MSSYDESMEDFIQDNGSESDFEASPPPKKAKKSPVAKAPAKAKTAKAPAAAAAAAAKKPTAAAAAKKAAGTADKPKKAAAPKKTAAKKASAISDDESAASRNGGDSDRENERMDLDEASGDESDAGAAKKKKAAASKKVSTKDASEMYQKVTQVEHVLKRPDTYIGSIEAQSQGMWVFDGANKSMVFRNISFVPGLYKIFDEILVNAADNKRNDPSMDQIKVVIDREAGEISCYNNGRGIPIEIHSKEKIYIPELIFGNLLTSSNYDDNEKKVTGGRNGYGAKLANIYSTEFTVETADAKAKKRYKQVFRNNMSKKGEPKITDNKKGEEWTKISFKPDFERFNMPDGIDDDTEALLMKRVYDLAGCVQGVTVWLNGEKLKIKNFKAYVEMYTSAINEISAGKKGKGRVRAGSASRAGSEVPVGASPGGTVAVDGAPKVPIVYEKFGDRWEVAFAPSEGQFQQVSFVNSIATTKGGTHVDYVTKQIVDGIIESISKKAKKQVTTLKPFTVKSHLWVFVNCLIENPAFDSQTKENMTLQAKKFGSKCAIGEPFLKKVINSGVIDSVLSFAQFKQDQLMKKSDGNKRSRMLGIAALDDANQAGTKNAKNCTLILTEGLSAKTFAVSGLAVVGRDTYGVFPLRGKLLNVRDATGKQLTENQEITHLKQILGLQHGKAYSSVDSLRYGRLMVMTDQDHDGSHIKGLIINFLDHFFPGLLQIPGFLVEFITPIVKVTKGKKSQSFFTIPEYENWKEETDEGRGWVIKYYKGLGTSTATDAKTYFSDLKRHMLKFGASGAEDRQLVDMAFNKKKADDRKEWLRSFVPGTYLDHSIKEIPIRDFINKELILFSMADNMRSIPSVVDGFKPGQRKVLFGCFKRNLKGEIKVAQLVGYISEITAYHHGEASLAGTIVGMAQHFVGNNNINVLSPNGQFGTRLQGGKDHASPRYIFTAIAPITRHLFHKNDDAVLTYLNDDGQSIEPAWFMPILPMVLVNGSDGIGTGWSSAMPNYNPAEVSANIRRKIAGQPMEPMHPWFRGFKGTIESNGVGRYTTTGIAAQTDADTVEIFELPIRSWTNTYVEQLLAWSQSTEKQPAIVSEFVSQSTDIAVHLVVTLTAEGKSLVKKEGLEKALKLTSSLATTNMVCFDVNGKIKKYASPEEIIDDFYDVRLSYYMKRKDHMTSELTYIYERLSNQARFIKYFIEGKIKISGREHADIVHDLRKLQFKPFPKKAKAVVAADPDASIIDPADLEETDDLSAAGSLSDYDYLLEMSISSLTAAKAKKLLAQRDEREKELHVLLELTPKQMWLTDLDAFDAAWEEVLERDEATYANSTAAVAKKGKGKVGGMKGNTLESAFAKAAALKAQQITDINSPPAKKAAAAKKATAPKAEAKPKVTLAKTKAEPAAKAGPSKAAPAKKKIVYDEDMSSSEADITLHDDDSMEQSAVSDNAPAMDEDEDEDDFVIRPPAKRKAAPVAQEEDEEDEEPVPKKAPAPAKAKRATSSKVIELSSDVDNDSGSEAEMDEDEDEESFIVPPKKARK